MKKLSLFITACALLCGCVGMNYNDGDSTKKWLVVDSSTKDMDGDVTDVCYRLNLRFSPAEAITRLNTDNACITKCCWYSERKEVTLNFNTGFADEMVKNAIAKQYAPESLTFYISYSPFLNAVHGRVSQKSALSSDGLVSLTYNELKDAERYLKIEQKDLKPVDFDKEKAKQGALLFKKDADKQKNAAAAEGVQTAAGNNEEDQALLEQQLKYERTQAVALVKRFYDEKIDAYILSIDKAQKRKGMVLLSNDRKWLTSKTDEAVYRVTCRVSGKLGTTQDNMKDYPIACGVYEVNLNEQTVAARDTDARSIVNNEYNN